MEIQTLLTVEGKINRVSYIVVSKVRQKNHLSLNTVRSSGH
jgi:hypothetical protein